MEKEKKTLDQIASSAVETAEKMGPKMEKDISSPEHIKGLEAEQQAIGIKKEKLMDFVALMKLAQNKEGLSPEEISKQIKPGQEENFKKFKNQFDKNPDKFRKSLEQVERIIEETKSPEKLSDQAQKAKEKAGESLMGKIWNAVKHYGKKAVEGVKKVWKSVKEFASTKRGKRLLIGIGVLLVIGALAGSYFWLMGGALQKGTDFASREALSKGIGTLKESSGSNWKIVSGAKETWDKIWGWFNPALKESIKAVPKGPVPVS